MKGIWKALELGGKQMGLVDSSKQVDRQRAKVASCDATLLLDNIDKLHSTEGGILRVRNNLNLGNIDIVKWCQEKV